MEDSINFFNVNGFVLLKNYFTEEEADNIVHFADDLENWDEQAGKWMIFFEKNNNNNNLKSRIENFFNYHKELKLFVEKKVKNTVDKIYGENMSLFKDKLNWKYGGGKGFRAHQDQPAWTDFEPDRYITAAMFANNSTKEKGCLEFGVGENKFTGLCKYNTEGLGELDSELEKQLRWDITETSPRDLVLFDSYVPHRSGKNITETPRRIFYFTYHDKKYGNLYDSYIINKRKYFPPNIERTDKVEVMGNKYNLANPTE